MRVVASSAAFPADDVAARQFPPGRVGRTHRDSARARETNYRDTRYGTFAFSCNFNVVGITGRLIVCPGAQRPQALGESHTFITSAGAMN